MTTMTAATLLERLEDRPEILAEMRELLNKKLRPHRVGRPTINAERDAEIAAKVWAGTDRRLVCHEYGLSMARINQILAYHKNPNPAPKNKNEERDRLILERVKMKVPRTKIAKEFGLSFARVNQIVLIAKAHGESLSFTLEGKIDRAMKKYSTFEPLEFHEIWYVFVRMYESIARKVAGDLLNGMSQYEIMQKYPSDCTGGDLELEFMHYRNAYLYFVDESTNTWKR